MTTPTSQTTAAEDILVRLASLYEQATVDRSHFYVASVVRDATAEIMRLRNTLRNIRGIAHLMSGDAQDV